jgi:hypothetical protein
MMMQDPSGQQVTLTHGNITLGGMVTDQESFKNIFLLQ